MVKFTYPLTGNKKNAEDSDEEVTEMLMFRLGQIQKDIHMPDSYKPIFKDLDPKYFDLYSAISAKDQQMTFTMILKVPDSEIEKMENPDHLGGGDPIHINSQIVQSIAFDQQSDEEEQKEENDPTRIKKVKYWS